MKAARRSVLVPAVEHARHCYENQDGLSPGADAPGAERPHRGAPRAPDGELRK